MTDHDETLYVRHMLDSAREAVKISERISRSDLTPFGTETLALIRYQQHPPNCRQQWKP
jgi:hypothetical protein